MAKSRQYEYTIITIEVGALYVVRVPQDVADDPFKSGDVLHHAEVRFKNRRVVVVGENTGEIVGNLDLKRQVQGVGLSQAIWRPWNTEG